MQEEYRPLVIQLTRAPLVNFYFILGKVDQDTDNYHH